METINDRIHVSLKLAIENHFGRPVTNLSDLKDLQVAMEEKGFSLSLYANVNNRTIP